MHRPAAEPIRSYALFAHCFTCSKDLRAARRISAGLADRGIATLRFDFTGLGESEGDFADTHFSSNIEDLLAAANFLRSEYRAPSLLVGHSLGGAAVLAAARRIPESTAVATIGAPCSANHVAHLLESGREEIASAGEAVVSIGGRPFRITQAFLEDLETNGKPEGLANLGRALVVLHSPQDNIVGIDNASRIYQVAKHPKSFVSLDGAEHLLSRDADSTYVADVLATWASRYLPDVAAGAAPNSGERVRPQPGEVEVTSVGPFTQRVRTEGHRWLADEPTGVGGSDLGPNPYDQLLAALGTCTSMTLQMYARRKRWPLEGVRVKLRHDRIHAQDCEECEKETGLVDRIERQLELVGPLDAEQRARLLQMADRCPIHRTLENEIRVETALVD